MTETMEQEATPPHRRRRSSAFSTLDQLRYALEYPLSPADTIKHHLAEEEGEANKPESDKQNYLAQQYFHFARNLFKCN